MRLDICGSKERGWRNTPHAMRMAEGLRDHGNVCGESWMGRRFRCYSRSHRVGINLSDHAEAGNAYERQSSAGHRCGRTYGGCGGTPHGGRRAHLVLTDISGSRLDATVEAIGQSPGVMATRPACAPASSSRRKLTKSAALRYGSSGVSTCWSMWLAESHRRPCINVLGDQQRALVGNLRVEHCGHTVSDRFLAPG